MTIELGGASLQEGAWDGLTLLEVWVGDKKIWPTEEVYQVSLTNVGGQGTAHPLVSVTVPAGQVWDVQIQGTVTASPGFDLYNPAFRIGSATSARFGTNAAINFSGTVTSSNATIAMVTNAPAYGPSQASFTGTVTIRK